MSWALFFPITLWRTIFRPITTMKYAMDQLSLREDARYRSTVSPPVMLILSVLLGQTIELAVHGTNPIVASHHGFAAMINDNTTLLLLRITLFGIFPLVLATRYVRRSEFNLDRDTLKAPFYAQCFAMAPVALAFIFGTSLVMQPAMSEKIGGALCFSFAITFFFVVQVRWFRQQLDQSIARAVLDVGLGLIEGIVIFVALAIIVAS
ncbi:MAG: hypothetical protein JZU55_04955 [Afipia sp.]|nr:hypothetical protein [Afipia sp.]